MFRGSASGYGITIDTNPRLFLASLDHELSASGMIDFKLTSWNRRLKFQKSGMIDCIDPRSFPFQASKEHFLSMQEQSSFKLIVYVDGNVGASRLGEIMSLGSTVIIVKSALPHVWLMENLTAMVHYIPCQAVQNIMRTVKWCFENKEKCREVALAGKEYAMQRHAIAKSFASRNISREAGLY